MWRFCENSQFLAVNYFHKKAPSHEISLQNHLLENYREFDNFYGSVEVTEKDQSS